MRRLLFAIGAILLTSLWLSGVADAQSRVVPACVGATGHMRTVTATQPCFASEQRVLRRVVSEVEFAPRVSLARLPAPNVDAGGGGLGPLEDNTSPYGTALGFEALFNEGGLHNTAMGYRALYNGGQYSTAIGSHALYSNSGGTGNTATGYHTLFSNTTGNNNAAVGYGALNYNTTGNNNTAVGYAALLNNTTGIVNTAVGNEALLSNTTGSANTGVGDLALYKNTEGEYNTATGLRALFSNTLGIGNTATGQGALSSNIEGNNNIAVGSNAGFNVLGSDNIMVGNQGASSDNGTIRIGTEGTHTNTSIAGIVTNSLDAGAVVGVQTDGRLGTLAAELLPPGPQGPAGPGLVTGSLLFLVAGSAPDGYTLVGTMKLTLDSGGKKPTALVVSVYQKQ